MRLDWKAVLGIIITVLLLWWALHGVPFGEVWIRIREADPWLLLASVAVATAGFGVRALRWKVLLHPLRPGTAFRTRFAAVSVGFMANNVLPVRVGEFARAYALSRLEPVSASGAFGTLVVERALDGLTLLVFLLVAMMWPNFPGVGMAEGGSLRATVSAFILLIGVMVVGILVLFLYPRPFVRTAERAATYLPEGLARLLVDALRAFLDALEIVRSPRLLLAASAWTVGFWAFQAVSFWLGMAAFGIHLGYVAAVFTETVVGFFVAVPSAPGFFGTFHSGARVALSGVYGVEQARALAFAFGYHLGGWIPITAIGLWYAWQMGLSLGEVGRSEERVEHAVEEEHPEAARLLARGGKDG
ncbi:MAG TPA: lysylphosphatidylglycerol synthase transmembrane domain-containing protein, partial [Longimicrobiales bacterium]|nr:lysylphosphatidylglycerol synthase transmembrane domain-containing protein [Longimicrobiales bacterium]